MSVFAVGENASSSMASMSHSDQPGDVEVAVHDVVGDRVHHRVGPQRQLLVLVFHLLAHAREAGVIAVPDGDHEVGPDEHHDLAGLDDLAGQRHGLVFDVVDRLEHQEQGVVVAFQLRPLVGVHGVLDGQRVQAENLGHRLHLVLVGFVQADPDERLLAAGFRVRGPSSRAAACVYLPGSRAPST